MRTIRISPDTRTATVAGSVEPAIKQAVEAYAEAKKITVSCAVRELLMGALGVEVGVPEFVKFCVDCAMPVDSGTAGCDYCNG